MKPITTSTFTFRDIREGGYLYVDKTAIFHSLVQQFKGVFFLSRPRRFGKSLTISTLEEIFNGNKDLFEGLAIYNLPYNWKKYPVIRIDLGSRQADTSEKLEAKLLEAISENAHRFNLKTSGVDSSSHFLSLISQISESQGKVVILIDEYDKPILGNIDNPQVGEILKVLKAFYSVVKTADASIRFAFLTGVSKFSKVSVFSDLNNLTDLTMDSRYAAFLGFTQEELEMSFSEYIELLTKKEGISRQELIAKIRNYYNGYRFSEENVTVYNPVSCGKLFETQKFANYWFETGTPTMLINLMKNRRMDIDEEKKRWVDSEAFSAYEVERLEILPLLFQTGYMTIADTRQIGSLTQYRLDFPNLEVATSFTKVLLSRQTDKPMNEVTSAFGNLLAGFFQNDLGAVFLALQSLFAGINQELHIPLEKYYQSLFVMVFRLLGAEIQTEVKTADGRIDAIVQGADTTYIIEFKLNGTAKEAIDQIRDKNYCLPYKNTGKKIIAVGVEFSREKRNITEWLTEQY
ncbi:MAG: ATP-binding protein [Candidatus Riflebacteria bacterium]|nr:ATP-binding protein [Candidatus Riflebacteria bacterium]